MTKQVVTTEYKALTGWDDENDIVLVIKKDNQKKTKRIRGFQWYFLLHKKDYKKLGKQFFDDYAFCNTVQKLVGHNDYVKVYCNKSIRMGRYTVRTLLQNIRKQGIMPYEADLSLTKRFIIDKNIKVEGDLNLLYFDIETDDSQGGIEIGRDTILSWAACDNNDNIWFEHGDEEQLLLKFVDLCNNHDVICGWNSGSFDIPYLQSRMEKYNIKFDWRTILHIDMMQRAVRLYSYEMFQIGLKGFSLNEVARCFIDAKKEERGDSILSMYQNNFEQFKKYNIRDVTLLRELDTKMLITSLMIKECEWTGAFLDRFYLGELLDNFILRKAKEKDNFQLTRMSSFQDERKALEDVKIRGGFVMKPIKGLHKNIRVFDFKSLYPSMIVSWNIGQDTLIIDLSLKGKAALDKFLKVGTTDEMKIEEVAFMDWYKFLRRQKKILDPDNKYVQTANNAFFRKDISSFIGGLIQELLEQRATWRAQAKKMKPGSPEYNNIMQGQGVVKEMANSMYGITADKSSRYFNQSIAEGITLTGQFLNKATQEIAKKYGHPSIYGDTDSVFVKIDDDAKMQKLLDKMNKTLKEFLLTKFDLPVYTVFLEYEKKFGKLIMLDKKRYTGILTEKDGHKVSTLFSRGTENIKKNTIPIARKAFIELIDMIVVKDTSLKVVKPWLQDLKNKILNEEIAPEELIIMTKVSKAIASYKSKSTHVRLAERLIKEGKLLPIVESKRTWGARLEYITIEVEHTDKKTGKITTSQEGITLDEYKGVWDRRYYWDIQVYAPIMRVLQTVWPKEDWESHSIVLYEKEQRSKAREEAKIQREKDKIVKQKEREKKKKEQAKVKLLKEKEKIKRQKEREKLKQLREKEREKKKKEREKKKKERDIIKAKKELTKKPKQKKLAF